MASGAERAAYLDRVGARDPALRARVEKLLEAQARAGDFMRDKARSATVDAPVPAEAEKPGTRIGPYKLLQVIGEGGMGSVYMAEQTHPVERRVALKVVKPGMDSGEIVARFEAERQALALMDHQCLAKVFDAGATKSGRPYFVMELRGQHEPALRHRMLAGETAFQAGDEREGLAQLRKAVAAEDRLRYQEPSSWMMPARHALGALLLDAGEVAEAEAVYRKDLDMHAENGWALHGLAQCLERRGLQDEAAAVRLRFEDAWADATVKRSCFCARGAGDVLAK